MTTGPFGHINRNLMIQYANNIIHTATIPRPVKCLHAIKRISNAFLYFVYIDLLMFNFSLNRPDLCVDADATSAIDTTSTLRDIGAAQSPGGAMRVSVSLMIVCFLAACLLAPASRAAEPTIPNLWDARERLPKPDISLIERVRFLTTADFPPFNFLDSEGRLSGFHIELARAICGELDIVARCQIQALPWNELDQAMAAGHGEAVIAGIAISAETRERYAFSRPYLRLPARFVAPKASDLAEPMYKAVAQRRIGVLAGSAHESMLRNYFADARPVTYTRAEWLHGDLRTGKLDGAFGDGMRLSFWLAGASSEGCCQFVGGPYIASEFLGQGLAIAVRRDQAELAQAFDFALRELTMNGTFAELYLRYFPIGFY